MSHIVLPGLPECIAVQIPSNHEGVYTTKYDGVLFVSWDDPEKGECFKAFQANEWEYIGLLSEVKFLGYYDLKAATLDPEKEYFILKRTS